MRNSNRVDVVVADGEPAAGVKDMVDVLGDPVQGVDVAPDPKRRIILLAPTKTAGHEHAERLGIEPVAIVTPRSPVASRSILADEILEAPDLTAEVVAELMVHAGPSLATTEVA
ncbi:hypothetical protein ACIP5T_00170 [Microbacterium sp. NPDC088619]|uniref:hypothetical protein n=1 Tax=Microbacterium sp. NPDC088619 TaxID=3364196 RepID=UPI0037FB4F07